jgi:NADH-quinone oxidoreductase subunit E
MARLTTDNTQRARDLIALYPQPRSALIPMMHLAQEQDGHLSEEAMVHIAELIGLTPAEVRGTATFYDMLFTEPVGRHLISVCTNIACLLNGGYELLEHAEEALGVRAGGTTADGEFTIEEVECIALCGNAPCLTVNWRFFGDVTDETFDGLVDDLRAGRLREVVPPHGTLCRARRAVGLLAEGSGPAAGTATAAGTAAAAGTATAPGAAVGTATAAGGDQPAATERPAGGYPEPQPAHGASVGASKEQEQEVRTPGGVESAGGASPGPAGNTVGTGKAIPGGPNPAPEETTSESTEETSDAPSKPRRLRKPRGPRKPGGGGKQP